MSALSVTAANVIPSTRAIRDTSYSAGATITAGQSVYLDSSSLWQLSDADGASALKAMQGVSACGASAGQPLTVIKSDPGFTPGFTALAGDTIWLSATAGGLTKTQADITGTSGAISICAGIMLTTTTMNLNITTGGSVA